MSGELHKTFLFPTAQLAKSAWEAVEKASGPISCNRWALDNTDPGTGRAVTVLTEEDERPHFERAVRILERHGTEIALDELGLELMRQRRARQLREGGRAVRRAPSGTMLFPGGLEYPFRRPQG